MIADRRLGGRRRGFLLDLVPDELRLGARPGGRWRRRGDGLANASRLWPRRCFPRDLLARGRDLGLGAALEIAGREGAKESGRLTAMCADFAALVSSSLPGVSCNGHPVERIPGNVSLSIAGVEPLALMHRLNAVASFSASSACATDKVKTSDVLLAMFGDTPRARQAFRVSPGRSTSAAELAGFAADLIAAAQELRRFAA